MSKSDPVHESQKVVIRRAALADVPGITRIYNEGIIDRIATLEMDTRTEEERAEWLASRDDAHPVLVAELASGLLGWASINVFNPRPAYRYVADISVYVARETRGHGVGSLLLEALIAEANRIGYHKLVLAAFPTNHVGRRLYRKFSFREVGVYKEQGVIDGRWVDTVVMERILNNDLPPRE